MELSSGHGTQVSRLGLHSKRLYPLGHLPGPSAFLTLSFCVVSVGVEGFEEAPLGFRGQRQASDNPE